MSSTVPWPGHLLADKDTSMTDFSVSRPSSRLHYTGGCRCLTVANYPNMGTWPPTVQVLGKDILKFHSIYWPAIPLCLGLPLPTKLLVHSHWTVDQVKISKSLGNVVDPNSLVDNYTVDGTRYFLLREGVPHCDGNFSEFYEPGVQLGAGRHPWQPA